MERLLAPGGKVTLGFRYRCPFYTRPAVPRRPPATGSPSAAPRGFPAGAAAWLLLWDGAIPRPRSRLSIMSAIVIKSTKLALSSARAAHPRHHSRCSSISVACGLPIWVGPRQYSSRSSSEMCFTSRMVPPARRIAHIFCVARPSPPGRPPAHAVAGGLSRF